MTAEEIKKRMRELENHWCGVGKNSPEHKVPYQEWKKLKGELPAENFIVWEESTRPTPSVNQELRVALGQAILRMKQVEAYKRCEREGIPSCTAAIELAEAQLRLLANVQAQ